MARKKNQATIIKAASFAALMIVFLSFVLIACLQRKALTCVKLSYSFPTNIYVENSETKIYTLRDTISIFYYLDFLIYRLPPTVNFETDEKIAGSEPYFIYNKKDTFGILLSSLTDSTTGVICGVDSFLFNRAFNVKDVDIPADSLWFLSDVKRDPNGILIEKYASIKQGDEMSVDTIYYYYSNRMNKVKYSFSTKLDSLKKIKLFKTRLLFNSKFSSTYNTILPKREISFEFREEEPTDSNDIYSIIKKYQSIIKRTGRSS